MVQVGAALVSQLSSLEVNTSFLLAYSSISPFKANPAIWDNDVLLVSQHGTATRAKHGQRHTKHLHVLQPQALESCNDSFVRILLLISNTLPCIGHTGYDATKV